VVFDRKVQLFAAPNLAGAPGGAARLSREAVALTPEPLHKGVAEL
jgi:hypothetical protein